MLPSRITIGVFHGLLLSLYLLVIYIPDVKATLGYKCDNCTGTNETCTNGICVCEEAFFDSNGTDPGGTCDLKLYLGSTCPAVVGENVCMDPNAMCIYGKCVCGSNYYDDNGAASAGICQLKLDLGSTCPAVVGENVCMDLNAMCIDGKCVCGSNYYDDNGAASDGICQLKLDLGSTCPAVVGENVCMDLNAMCINGICVCGSNYYDDNGAASAGICQLKLDLGSTCPAVVGENVCMDLNAMCINGKCVCGSNYYDDNGAASAGICQLITNLQITSLVYGNITENTIPISWTPPNDRTAVSYYRVAYGPADNRTVVNQTNVGNQTSFVLNSLDPGKKYSISVFSVNTQTDLTERSTSVTKNQTTKPGIPGALVNYLDIDASSGNITVEWNRSIGVVTGYGGRLENTTLFIYNKIFNISGTNSSQIFSELKSGTWYTFTVQAVIRYADTKTLYSDIHTQLIKTRVQAPNPPTNLICLDATDRAITLKWIQPQLPNGDIISYIIVIERTQPRQDPYHITSQGTNVQYIVAGLTAGSFYTFQVYTRNENYTSNSSAQVTSCATKPQNTKKVVDLEVKVTDQTVADPPEDLLIKNVPSRSGTVTWNKPSSLNGILYGYSIQILNDSSCVREVIWKCTDCQGSFPSLPNPCSEVSQQNASSTALLGPQYYAAVDLFPDTNYTLTVTAITGLGRGHPASTHLPTKEEKFDLGSTCSNATGVQVCKDANAVCSNGICACGSNYYDDNGATPNGTCKPRDTKKFRIVK